jgi:N-acetylglucosaminyldiphosphoundecaprenol N-acetyl-beta-D-mannosaminyltransferase
MTDVQYDIPSGPPKQRIESLNLSVTPSTVEETLKVVSEAAPKRVPTIIGAHNLHSAYLYHTDAQFRRFCEAAHVILVDGWPILSALRRERTREALNLHAGHRIGSTDWIGEAIQLPTVSRVCVIGASASSNARFIERQRKTTPSVEFMGYPGNPWDPADMDDLIERVLDFNPELTLVGMGMPLQERVVMSLVKAGMPGVIATVGGAIDQLSGEQAHAPRWTGRMRVEWLWRLASNPKRLAHRYLIEPIKLWGALRAHKRVGS